VPRLEILVKRLRQSVKRITHAIAIFMAFILISVVFTYFKPIDVESIGYQYYGDKTYRVEKTNQITNLLHGENLIRRKVTEIKSQTSDPQRQIDLALSWVTQYVRPQDASPAPVISDDYYNILKRGSGYCDQAAYVFSVLSTRLGIPARMIMLRDRDGVSHHTAAEVYLDDKWKYIDPWLGVFPHKPDGTAYTRFEFAKNQAALVKYGYAPGITGYDFTNSVVFETFPFMSSANLFRKILGKLSELQRSNNLIPGGVNSAEIIKSEPLNQSSQNFAFNDSQLSALDLYNLARTKHLQKDFVGARSVYSMILRIDSFPVIDDSARFFLGVTYFDQSRYAEAQKYFMNVIIKHQENAWINSEYRFLAESLVAQGKITEAKTFLQMSNSQGAQARLKNLDSNYAAGLTVPFISY